MHSERTYRTESGTYNESELAVVVWLNPEQVHRPHARLLATFTDTKSPNPMAFPIKTLRNTSEFANAHLASDDSVANDILNSTQTTPVIISLPLAREHLGWTDFYIPTTFTEPKK
jgi:hypothetical protein